MMSEAQLYMVLYAIDRAVEELSLHDKDYHHETSVQCLDALREAQWIIAEELRRAQALPH